jgi:hypothetical protein
MSQLLINHNPDLKKLQDEGLEVEIKGAYLIVSHVPYVNSQKKICYGKFVSNLVLSGNKTLRPDTHVIQFIGDYPCHKDGREIAEIKHQSQNQRLADNIVINHSFSNKPVNGYADYYDKFSRYIEIISAPAKSIDPAVTEKNFKKVVAANDEQCVFNYLDTNSSRAGISAISDKVKNQKVGIIGLGGTGSYILDLVAKTPVREIHLFDGDEFVQHNAFRCPGAATMEDLNRGDKKVEYFKNKYSYMRKGIVAHDMFINATTVNMLDICDFVFVSIDNGEVKKLIFDFLQQNNIPFIDVGIGLEIIDEQLIGIVRMTTSSESQHEHVNDNVSFANGQNDAYSTNIQIADLNALNATMAVIKWKKLAGVYQDLNHEHHSTYSLNVHLLTSDNHAA